MSDFDISVEINGYEFDLKLEYKFYPASKGSRDGFGVPLEPDEPAMIEIQSMKIDFNRDGKNFVEIDFPTVVTDDFEEKIIEDIS